MKRTQKKGFTLIELLVVIAIIGLLSTLAVVALNSARQKSRDAKRLSDIKQIQTALELYYSDSNAYPAAPAGALGENANALALCSNGGWKAACVANTDTTYMGQVPADPNTATTHYTYALSGTDYAVTFTLEGKTGSLAAGAHTATPNGIQ